MTIPAGDGLVAHVVDRGGPPVLWLHGYTLDHTVFRKQWARLPGFCHIGLDLPGHGASRALRPGDTLNTVADTVAAFAAGIGARRLVGLSFGTLLAVQVAAVGAFDRLILAAPGLAGGPSDRSVEQRYIELARLYATAGPGPHMTELWMRSPPPLFAGVGPEVAAVIDRHTWSELRGPLMYELTRAPQDAALLARIGAPTLIVLGEHELPAHRACAALLARHVPDCELELLSGGGHLALLQAPDAAAEVMERGLLSPRTTSPAA